MDIKFPLEKYTLLTQRLTKKEDIKKRIFLIMNDKRIDYEFRTTIMKPWHQDTDIASIGGLITGAKRYFLQNYLNTETLDPHFSATAFRPDEMEHFKKIVLHYVQACEIR